MTRDTAGRTGGHRLAIGLVCVAFAVVMGLVGFPGSAVAPLEHVDAFTDVPAAVLADAGALLPESPGSGAVYLSDAYSPNLLLEGDAELSVIFLRDGSEQANSLGYFTYTEDPLVIHERQLVFPRAEALPDGALQTGDTASLTDATGAPRTFSAGTKIGFFLVADGYESSSAVQAWDPSTASLPSTTPNDNVPGPTTGGGVYTTLDAINPEMGSITSQGGGSGFVGQGLGVGGFDGDVGGASLGKKDDDDDDDDDVSDPLDVAASVASAARHDDDEFELDLVSSSSKDVELEWFALSSDIAMPELKEFKLDGKKVWKEGSGEPLPLEDECNSGKDSERTLEAGDTVAARFEFKGDDPEGTSRLSLTLGYTNGATSSLTFDITWTGDAPAGDPVDIDASVATAREHDDDHFHMDIVSGSKLDREIASFALSADIDMPALEEFKFGGEKIWTHDGLALPTGTTACNDGSSKDRTLEAGDDPEARIVFAGEPVGVSRLTLVLNFTDGSSATIPFEIDWGGVAVPAGGGIDVSRHAAMIPRPGVAGFLDGQDYVLLGFEESHRGLGGSDDDFNDLVVVITATPSTVKLGTSDLPLYDHDPDGDGLGGSLDDYPDDPTRALVQRYPASGHNGIGLEDLYPQVGDGDYNDAVVLYEYTHVLDALGHVKDLQATFHLVARGGGHDHKLGLHIPGLPLTATGSVRVERFLTDESGTHVVEDARSLHDVIVFDERRIEGLIPNAAFALKPVAGKVFVNTESGSVERLGASARVNITFDVAVDPAVLGSAPYDLFFRINDGHGFDVDVHLAGHSAFAERREGLPVESGDDAFLDDNGYPWMLEVPHDWRFPREREHIAGAYPQFASWAASHGLQAASWYDAPSVTLVSAAARAYLADRDWTVDLPDP